MTTLELRHMLKQKIDSVNDDYLLEELLSIIEVQEMPTDEFVIPTDHEDLVKKGLNQVKSKETRTHNEVQDKVKKWLYK